MDKVRGFTFIEVLVSLLIIAVGVLGMIKLQMDGLYDNKFSSYRSLATALASDLFNRVRANAGDVGQYVLAIPASTPKNCRAEVCDQAELAKWDLYEWKRRVDELLPAHTEVKIDYSADFDGLEISFSWQESKDPEQNECGHGKLCLSYRARF